MFYMACGTQAHFVILTREVIERQDLLADSRFADSAARVDNRQKLMDILGEIFATEARDHWVERIRAAGARARRLRAPRPTFPRRADPATT